MAAPDIAFSLKVAAPPRVGVRAVPVHAAEPCGAVLARVAAAFGHAGAPVALTWRDDDGNDVLLETDDDLAALRAAAAGRKNIKAEVSFPAAGAGARAAAGGDAGAAAAALGRSYGGDGADGGASAARPCADVSEAVGPLFESEARAALSHCLAQVCPWAASRSNIITRFELSFGGSPQQADVFCYLAGDSHSPCESLPELGVHVVWPDAARAEVTAPALAALALDAGAVFSPADPERVGPHKYFVGEAYSGVAGRADKVRQLETEVDILCRRLADRTGLDVTDATQVVGAAALVFSAAGLPGATTPRAAQLPVALALVRAKLAACPHLARLAAAGRLLLVLLAKGQAPQTYHARDTSAALRALRNEQRSLVALLREICERLPPLRSER